MSFKCIVKSFSLALIADELQIKLIIDFSKTKIT
jgi:hypothetical protein